MEKHRLTTEDNPFNPFTQWDDWYFYDLSHGYNTCERLARISYTSTQLPDSVNDFQVEEAMNELIENGAFDKNGMYVNYKKVENPNLKQENNEKKG